MRLQDEEGRDGDDGATARRLARITLSFLLGVYFVSAIQTTVMLFVFFAEPEDRPPQVLPRILESDRDRCQAGTRGGGVGRCSARESAALEGWLRCDADADVEGDWVGSCMT